MLVEEFVLSISRKNSQHHLLSHLQAHMKNRIAPNDTIVRFVITEITTERICCEIAVIHDSGVFSPKLNNHDIFALQKRNYVNEEHFNAVLLVPTGIGAEIGGHSGDAGAVARLMAQTCDCLITHPNVMNAADINELPENGLYVEGSIISRLMMGTISLQKTRSNRILVLVDPHPDKRFMDATVNMVSAARAAAGYTFADVVMLNEPFGMHSAFTNSGRAAGRIEGLESVLGVLEQKKGQYDAVAVSSLIGVPANFHSDYFSDSAYDMVNPWGGVEAMLTHAISMLYDVPSAHAPMMSSIEVQNLDLGIVDPRKAAEPVSLTYLFCALKGLHRSPRIISNSLPGRTAGLLGACDIHCLIIPDGCIGLPTLAALEQGMYVIAVRENRNIMKNNLSELPFSPGQLHIVDNYLEASGVVSALRAGVHPESVRRPLLPTRIL
jgi:Protein of unknown function (DUF3326)